MLYLENIPRTLHIDLLSGDYTAILLSVEVGAAFPHDPSTAERVILEHWRNTASFRLPTELHPPDWFTAPSPSSIGTALSQWAQRSPRPLVIFIDEIDALRDETLIYLLRQLRAGYPNRPGGFPHSLALIGVRDVRDYKMVAGDRATLNTASPFNIKVESLTLRNFNGAEVAQLYGQHASATGQPFEPEVLQESFRLTQGQPWLVNALARLMVEEIQPDPSNPIGLQHIAIAKEKLILRQDTHLDSLVSLLQEDRVRAIIAPMLAGQELDNVPHDDIQFLMDVGLCRMSLDGGVAIANPIYQEVLPRVLSQTPQASLPQISPTWLTPDGHLDPDQLLHAFLTFWRQHGQPLLKSAPYHEIAPHLVLMAFLHRVVNGGGTLQREYAIGSDRMDLCLTYGSITLAMELKVWRQGRSDPLNVGLAQLDRYLDGLHLDTGWLIIFDQRQNRPPIAQRTTSQSVTSNGNRLITLIRA